MSFRIIPIILVDENRMVKTKRFKDPKYLGDPLNAVRIFNEKEVDELIVIDRSAAKRSEINWPLLTNLASEAFMPMAYAGGISNSSDADKLFSIGYEKIGLRSMCFEKPEMIKDLVNAYGAQAIIGIVDYEINFWGQRKAIGYPGKSLAEVCLAIEKLGVGELLLQSVTNEGCMEGFDLANVSAIADEIKIPLVISGGAKNLAHIIEAKTQGASAVAVGSMCSFVSGRDSILINYPKRDVLREHKLID